LSPLAHEILAQRIKTLDARPILEIPGAGIDRDIGRFVQTLAASTPQCEVSRVRRNTIEASIADELISECELLHRLGKRAPEVALGPLELRDQRCISTTRPRRFHKTPSSPEKAFFFDIASPSNAQQPSTKPFYVGLFSSTAVFGSFGMWWAYLCLSHGSSLFGLPWTIWELQVRTRVAVFEVSSAANWVKLLEGYGVEHDGLIFPDWNSIAADFDGVHMSAYGVAATQGICFSERGRVTAPPFWDVESTLWLRWVFDKPRLAADQVDLERAFHEHGDR